MFEGKERDEDKDTIYTVHVSYVEIYNEEIRDLLNEEQAGKKLDIKGNHGVIAGNNKNKKINFNKIKTYIIFHYRIICLKLSLDKVILFCYIKKCFIITIQSHLQDIRFFL